MLGSIRAKFITVYALCTLAFVLSITASTYIQGRNQLFDLAINNSLEKSKLYAQLFSSSIEKTVLLLRQVSELIKAQSFNSKIIQQELFNTEKVGEGKYLKAVYIDLNANLHDSSGHTVKLIDKELFHSLIDSKKEYIVTPPFMGQLSKIPVIAIGVPLKSKSGDIKGVIAVSIDLNIIAKELSQSKMQGDSYSWLIDKHDQLIFHPNYPFNIKDALSFGYPGLDTIILQAHEQDEGFGRYSDTHLNQDKIVTFSKVPNTPGWTLFITTLESDIFKSTNSILAQSIFTALVILAIFILILLHLTMRMTRPISELTESVRQSVQRKFAPITIKETNDEIGQLVRAYNEMTRTITVYTHELESLVDERTQELSKLNEQLSRTNSNLYQAATKDVLTNLYNRRAIIPILETEVEKSRLTNAPVSILMLDIDHFKTINDNFGHPIGDQVLIKFGQLLSQSCRGSDKVARWGGEEFIILASHATQDSANQLAEKLRNMVMFNDFEEIGQLTISIGIAQYCSGESINEWLSRVDKALYKAKANGRNQCEMSPLLALQNA
jgi:diguanylate cyclase (GGDEF)-like protein